MGSAGCLKITGRCQGRPRREEVRDTLDYVDHLLWFRKIYPWLWYVTILSGNIDTEPKQTWREVQQDMERAQKAKDRPEAEPEHELEPPQPVVPAPNRDGDVLGSAGSVDPSGSGQPAQPSVEGAAAGVGDAAAELVEGAARAKKLIDELLLKPN